MIDTFFMLILFRILVLLSYLFSWDHIFLLIFSLSIHFMPCVNSTTRLKWRSWAPGQSTVRLREHSELNSWGRKTSISALTLFPLSRLVFFSLLACLHGRPLKQSAPSHILNNKYREQKWWQEQYFYSSDWQPEGGTQTAASLPVLFYTPKKYLFYCVPVINEKSDVTGSPS